MLPNEKKSVIFFFRKICDLASGVVAAAYKGLLSLPLDIKDKKLWKIGFFLNNEEKTFK